MGNIGCSVEDCTRSAWCKGLCSTHYKRLGRGQDLSEPVRIIGSDVKRFMSYVDQTDDCWLWAGALKDDGYARFNVGGQSIYVHIFSYKTFVGDYDNNLQLDHLCSVRHCVNPDHLEPVTQQINTSRAAHATRTHCRYGHPYSGDNLYVNPAGSRACKACHKARSRDWARKKSLSYALAN
jgi:hypothetical protein